MDIILANNIPGSTTPYNFIFLGDQHTFVMPLNHKIESHYAHKFTKEELSRMIDFLNRELSKYE